MKKTIMSMILLALLGSLNAQNFPEMIKVEGGTFLMGDNIQNGQVNELPVHYVTLSTYWIAQTETTVLQWKEFCEETGRKLPPPPAYGWVDNAPIANINWYDATAYVTWLSQKTGKKYRIPTESEWEYAARGGNLSKGYLFSGSNDPGQVGWYNENSSNQSHPVAKKQPNELGLYDMTGNVWEWTNDLYADYDSSGVINPKGPSTGEAVVFRGGGLMEPSTYIRVSMRGEAPNREYTFRDLGLRVVYSDH